METMFYRPDTLGEAVELLDRQKGAVLVNGGSDIILEMAAGKIDPPAIVYLAGVEGLDRIAEEDDQVRIGGAVTYRQMERSPVCRRMTGLMEAVAHLGSPPVRAVATPAGNIATAAPSADCATMLLALGAELVLTGAQGERVVPQAEVYTGSYRTAITPGEIIREIRFPRLGRGEGSGYCRLARRKAQDIAKVLVGAVVRLDREGRCADATVSLGALNATAVLSPSTARLIRGLTREEAVAAAKAHFPPEAGLRESYFKHYKELVTGNAVARALEMAYTEARGRL